MIREAFAAHRQKLRQCILAFAIGGSGTSWPRCCCTSRGVYPQSALVHSRGRGRSDQNLCDAAYPRTRCGSAIEAVMKGLLGLVYLLLGACTQTEQADVAIRGVTVVDVIDGSLASNQTVLIKGNRIVAVGSADAVRVPDQAEVVEAFGLHLIPGLWDVHVHSAVSAGWHFPLFIAHGITSVRNMHTSVDTALELTNAVRRRVASKELLGPRFLANGPILDGAPPIQPGSVEASDPERGRALVDSLADGGADFIKIYDNLSRDTYDAVLGQARIREMPVDGHLPKMVSPEAAAAAGQRTLEHTLSLGFGCSAVSDSLRAEYARFVQRWPTLEFPDNLTGYFSLERSARETLDSAACLTTARRVAEAGTAVTPTLFIEWLEPATIVADSSRMAMVPASVREQWRERAQGPDYIGDILRGVSDSAAATVRQLHAAGVTLLAGTDVGNAFLVPGASLHGELGQLVESAGLSPLAALQAATLNPARVFGMIDSLGTIESGKLADLVLLDANPLADISNTRRIRAVVADGRLLRRADLDQLLVEAAAAAPTRQ